jgi:NAD(P)-dependent dehydrogenase (short-subunit alcohol dehydrogenase family)
LRALGLSILRLQNGCPKQTRGRMINISSVLGKSVCPDHGLLHYQSWHNRLHPCPRSRSGRSWHSVNALCPSRVDTEIAYLESSRPWRSKASHQSNSRLKRWRLFRSNGFSTLARWQTWFAMSLQNKPRVSPARQSISAAANNDLKISRGVLTTGALASIYTAFVRHGLHKTEILCCKAARGFSRE